MGILEDKLAIITGSTRGRRKEMVFLFSSNGAHIVVDDTLASQMEGTA